MEYLKAFKDECKKRNVRMTPQRVAVYEEIAKAKDHPSVDTIFRRVRKYFEHISFDTVNRTVLFLARAGLVKVIEGYGRAKRFDSKICPHYHARCIICDRLFDVGRKRLGPLKVSKGIKEEFYVVNIKVIVEVVCSKCQAKKASDRKICS